MKTLYEDLLYYLWEKKTLSINELLTITGDPIEVLTVGSRNTHSGPDYLNGKIKIGNTIWVGNIEMHIISSDWIKHKHQNDDAYKNVILHVVYEHDKDIDFFKDSKIDIPVLELKNLISRGEMEMYQLLKEDMGWIPCEKTIGKIDLSLLELYKSRLLVERLEAKTESITPIYNENKGDLEKTFFVLLARYFGASANLDSFEILANRLDYKALCKIKDNHLALSALIFGQAGFLNKPQQEDVFHQKLSNEYNYLKKKWNLAEVDVSMWKFGGMMPAGFPTARLALFTALINKINNPFDIVREKMDTTNLINILEVEPLEYWHTHFRFGKKTKRGVTSLSLDMRNRLIINAIVPMKFFYFKSIGDQSGMDYAISLLEEVKKESNSIISNWKKIGVKIKSSFDTQALLQLKTKHCDEKKCLSCPVGVQIMNVDLSV